MEVKVSVVLPVYNVENYLNQCIESLMNQTLKEIEIICVDDGSTDASLQILKELQERDDRIIILTQQNKFAGIARNHGLSVAKGKYVLFLDSDDFFEPTLLESIYYKGCEKDADIVLFGAKKYDNNTGETIATPWYLNRKVIKGKTVFNRNDFPNRILTLTSPAPWTKAFKREFVEKEKLQYQGLPNSNDAYFVLTALSIADRITWIDEDFVNYRVGLTNNIQSGKAKNPICFIQAYRAVYDELKRRGIYNEVEQSFVNVVLSGTCFNLQTINDEEARKEILRNIASPIFKDMNLLNYEDNFYFKKKDIFDVRSAYYIGNEILASDKRKTINDEYEILKESCYKDECPISVIIPIYNVEQYLPECLDSILNQTFKEIEVICVIDGSPDNSLEIVKNYAAKDERIKVINQVNMGVSTARNRGIKEAKGKYIYFMDGDDYLEEDTFESLYNYATEEDLDVIYFDAVCFSATDQSAKDNTYYIRKNEYPRVASGIDMLTLMAKNKEFRVSPCLQFIRRQHILDKTLFYHEGAIHEDNAFSLLNIVSSDKVGYTNRTFFHRRYRDNSIMTSNAAFKNSYGYFTAVNDVLSRLDLYNHLTYEQKRTVINVNNACLRSAINIYAQLSEAEKLAYYGLDFDEEVKFEMMIAQPAKMKNQIIQKNETIEKLKGSTVYRIKNSVKRRLPKKVIKTIRKTIKTFF